MSENDLIHRHNSCTAGGNDSQRPEDQIVKGRAEQRREDIAKETRWKMECIGRGVWEMVKSAIVRRTRGAKQSHFGK
jgi:hypothetical protein